MGRLASWLVLVLVMTTVGCVSKSTHDGVVAQLDECRQDKVAAQDAAKACEERFDREIERFTALDTTIQDVLPATMKEFQDEGDRIIELVPQQVQEEVAAYIDEFSTAMGHGFQILKEDSEHMNAQLQAAHEELQKLGVSSDTIQERVGTIQSSLEMQTAQRAEILRRTADIADIIRQFDHTKVTCKDCPDRLKLNRREREEISNFHDDVIGRLLALQPTGMVPAGEGDEEGEEDGEEDGEGVESAASEPG